MIRIDFESMEDGAKKSLSFQDMCKCIEDAQILENADGEFCSATEIFHYSPTGELYEIPYWFADAVLKLGLGHIDTSEDEETGWPLLIIRLTQKWQDRQRERKRSCPTL